MAEEEKKKVKQTKSPLIGAVAQPTTLSDTTKISADVSKELIDSIIDAGISGGLDISKLEDFTSISNSRSQIYQLLDTMAADSSVSAILKTYSEEVCEVADNGSIVWCESTDPNISKYVNYLLNTMNVDKYIYAWVYCLLKYGDVYLKLYRESDYEDDLFDKNKVNNAYTAKQSLHEDVNPFNTEFDEKQESLDENVNMCMHKQNDHYSYYVEMVPDPGTMFELTKFGKTYGYVETPNEDRNSLDYLNNFSVGTQNSAFTANYRMKSNDVNVYQADDYVHALLDDNFTRFPEKVDLFRNEEDLKAGHNAHSYTVKRGKSLLYDAYKVWREKALLENSILLNRVTKSSIVRNIQVELGDMPKSQSQLALRRIKELFEQKSAINVGDGMSEYANPGPVENNVYTALHNGKGAITINSIGGEVEVKNLGDLDQWVNKFYAAFGIPKAYYGYTDDGAGFNGGTSLAIISSVFAKSVKRVQNAIIQALTDAINLFLIDRGCKSYINNFVLKMKAPLTQEEKDYREDLSNRVSAISNIQSLFADIEDKTRKLEILKVLLGSLNYGDEIIEIIQQEIDATIQAQKEEAIKNEENNTEEESSTSSSTNNKDKEAPEQELSMVDLDLGNTSDAGNPAAESFNQHSGQQLMEDHVLGEKIDFLTESDDLPTPEELNSNIDFTKNE